AAARAIFFPTSTLPVNATLFTWGWVTSGAPAVSPNPVTTLTAPGGTPHSSNHRASSRAVSGVCSAGFRTHVHPAASAGASFHAAISNGKFQGIIWPATPAGSRRERHSAFAGTGFTWPITLV